MRRAAQLASNARTRTPQRAPYEGQRARVGALVTTAALIHLRLQLCDERECALPWVRAFRVGEACRRPAQPIRKAGCDCRAMKRLEKTDQDKATRNHDRSSCHEQPATGQGLGVGVIMKSLSCQIS